MKKLVALLGLCLGVNFSYADISADMTNIGVQVISKDTIRVRNVSVDGYGNYFIDFKWNSTALRMDIVNADKDTMPSFVVTQKRYTAAKKSQVDLNIACSQEFGASYRAADWSDVNSTVGINPVSLQTFMSTINGTMQSVYFLTYGSMPQSTDGSPYVMTVGNGWLGTVNASPLVYLQSSMILWAANNSTQTGNVLCYKSNGASNPFVK